MATIGGCKGVEKGVIERETVRIVERETLVSFVNPADSLTLTALLECDSMSNILIKALDEHKSSRFETHFSLDKGALEYRVQKAVDTVYIPVKERQEVSSLAKQEVVTQKEYVRGFLWWSGLVSWSLLTIILSIKISRLYRKG